MNTMSNYPWKPLRCDDLDRQIDSAFDELIHRCWGAQPAGAANAWQPEIDVYETPEAYIVEADIPGVPPDQIQVEIDEHSLTIAGARHTATIARSAHSVRVERRKGRFSRRFPLEHAIDPAAVERTHAEGTLHLVLPKRDRIS